MKSRLKPLKVRGASASECVPEGSARGVASDERGVDQRSSEAKRRLGRAARRTGRQGGRVAGRRASV